MAVITLLRCPNRSGLHLDVAVGEQSANTSHNLIFGKTQNKIQNPANLSRLVNELVNREIWSVHGTDVNGDA
ncbi:hypothetical protein [Saccharopolyspora pogona]|uniref:hypothetical protein n=1 Tax=Saccharopolyspora pogona TaxID=333966 RepID=UPI001CC25A68|nr:hypothetical protein [Saccharopolyspora pogona]